MCLSAASPWLAKCQVFLTMKEQFYLNSHLHLILILKMSYNSHHPRTKTIGDERFSQSLAAQQTTLLITVLNPSLALPPSHQALLKTVAQYCPLPLLVCLSVLQRTAVCWYTPPVTELPLQP